VVPQHLASVAQKELIPQQLQQIQVLIVYLVSLEHTLIKLVNHLAQNAHLESSTQNQILHPF
jgi:hypothetical protein